MRRRAQSVLLAILVSLLLGSYILYSRRVVMALRRDAANTGQMYARVFRAQADTSVTAGNAALLDLAVQIRQLGVPLVVTDTTGRPTFQANLPFRAALTDRRVLQYVADMDRDNPPVAAPGVGTVHIGDSPVVVGLRIIPILLSAMLALVLFAGGAALRTRYRADREQVWAGMARESAHQLATPLSSLSGWVELLRDRAHDPTTASAVSHMTSDLERLERVAHRFERIGRPPRNDPVDVGELVTRIAEYFQARVPTLAHSVTIAARCEGGPYEILGDAVLLEWALEALTKNALDALAGRGGRIYLIAARSDDEVKVRIADDGPGIPREIRARIFDPGFSTKETGWGIGLSLAKRIIEENHRGKLLLVPATRGATFDIILPG